MLTPMDIHSREFKKGLRGYKESEVDEFLDRVVADYEKLWRDNERLKEQIRFNEKEIKATVASLRVDSIAAAGFGMSRSKAATEIAADKVKLNWQTVKNAAQSIKEGDVLSMHGRGRLEVTEIRGQTKKGRISVVLKRYF